MYQNEKQKYKIRALKLVFKLFKPAKVSCRYWCLLDQFWPNMVSFTVHSQLYPIKSLIFCHKVRDKAKIQSNTTPDPGHPMENVQKHKKTSHTSQSRGQLTTRLQGTDKIA